MRWQYKALAFRMMETIPFGHNIHYLAQRYITQRVLRSEARIASYNGNFLFHIKNMKKFSDRLEGKTMFEFGAGWDLCSNIFMYCFGIDRQIAVDLHRLAKAEAINRVIDYHCTHHTDGMIRKPRSRIGDDLERDLYEGFGIDYRAPQDAAATRLPDGSVDFIVSTATLEHIPKDSILEIMRECRRLCHRNSIVSMVIDYSDHYAHSDRSISRLNFLKFNDEEWHKYSQPIHYQNRLRHRDYREIFKATGFDIVEEQTIMADGAVEMVKMMPIASKFAAYSPEELAIGGGYFALRKSRAHPNG